MSKKKAFSGSTMTLRDFHGGSIPSDLPLPSAPGMTVERSGHERHNAGGWMSPSVNRGYGGDRSGFLRQGSANGVRTFEDKALFFPNPANIGRNYDEDERKPVDSHIRRGHGTDSVEDHMYDERQSGHNRLMDRHGLDNRANYGGSSYTEPRVDNYVQDEYGLIPPSSRHMAHQVSSSHQQDVLPPRSPGPKEQSGYYQSRQMSPGPQYSSQQQPNAGSPPRAWRQTGGTLSQHALASPAGPGSGSATQNVWTARREGESIGNYSFDQMANDSSGPWKTQTVASRIAQASAVDKVSSGRWNSRLSSIAIEQPQDPVEGLYMHLQGRSNEVEPAQKSFRPENDDRHPSDMGGRVYSDSSRDSYNDHGKSVYMDSGRFSHSESGRARYADMGFESVSDTGKERYGETGHKTPAQLNRDRNESGLHYVESGRGDFPNTGQVRHMADGSILGYSDPRWRFATAYAEAGRPVGMEATADAEPGPLSHGSIGRGVTVGMEATSGDYLDVRAGSASGDYLDVRADGNRGSVSDSGRRNLSSYDQRNEVEIGRGAYLQHTEASSGRYILEARRGQYPDAGRTTNTFESGLDPPGRDIYGFEDGRGVNVGAASRGAYANERTRGTFNPEYDRAPSPGSGRTQTDRGGRPPLDLVVQDAPGERPKLKLLPRTKPLEITQEDASFSQEVSKDAQHIAEGGQSFSALSSETSFTEGIGTSVPNSIAGQGPAEMGEDGNRPNGRPKLNLKPRSVSADALADAGSKKERQSVFGGARPREQVLKERGVEDSVIFGIDPVPTPGGGARRPNSGGNQLNVGDSEQEEVQRMEKDKHGEERLDGWHYERPEGGINKSAERQDINRLERIEHLGGTEEWLDQDLKEDWRGRERYENRRAQERKELERQDVDKQGSWRQNSEMANSSSGRFSLSPGSGMADSSRVPGRYGYNTASSAAELAHAFSRSASIGSGTGGPVRNYTSQRSLPRSPGHAFGMGYESSTSFGVSPKEAPFSRLTEGPPPGPRDIYAAGVPGGYRQTNGY